MALRGGTSVSTNSKTVSRGITIALSSAILEWLLMISLFIHAILSYLITQFASYYKLQLPCLLCSRLDHVMGNRNPGFYWDLICHNHKLEISSLFHNICESCLSYATTNRTLSTTHCSCCNEPCIFKGHAIKSVQARSITSEVQELDVATKSGKESDENYLMSRGVRPTMSINLTPLRNNMSSDSLSHIGYTKLKIMSDTESEVPVCVSDDDDDSNTLVLETNTQKKDLDPECLQRQPLIVRTEDDLTLEKLIDTVSEQEPSMDDHGSEFVGPVLSIEGHGLEELNWQQAEHKADLLLATEDITVEDVTTSSKSTENICQVAEETLHVWESEDAGEMCKPESENISKAENVQITKNQTSSSMELGDAYKIAVGNQVKQLSLKQLNIKKSTQVSEDLKLLLSQLSANRGADFSIPDISPRIFGNYADLKTPDAASTGIKLLQHRTLLERNESGFESLEGSIVSVIEGESVISQLKRQFDHDRALLGGLYKELEEERNASAIAANEAMAMITRLQEEKAAVHMEALHYLRMMEEQSEYDMEALQYSNDLLTQREKEIQDLEAQLESYKNQEKEEDKGKIKMDNNKMVFEFDDEKVYISEYLKKLEKRVNINNDNKGSEENEFGNIVSYLNNRLEALEADRDFLELIVNTLKNKDQGIGYVHEIASHLRELRRIGEKRKDEDVVS